MQPHGRFSEKITIRGLMAVGLPPDLSYEAVCTSNDVQFYNAGQVKFRILFKTCIERVFLPARSHCVPLVSGSC